MNLKCLEPLTGVACGLGAFALGALDAGVTATALMSGAALLTAFREAGNHGLESKNQIENVRLAIVREFAGTDLKFEEREALGEADSALARCLVNAIPDREELGSAAVSPEGFPVAACSLIMGRLSDCDPLFRDNEFAHQFATRVIRTSIREAINSPEYIRALAPYVLTAIGQGIAQANVKLDDHGSKLDQILAHVDGLKSRFPEDGLRAQIIRLLALDQTVSVEDIAQKLEVFAADFDLLRAKVDALETKDNRAASAKAGAQQALERGDLDAARHHLGEAAEVRIDQATESVRSAAEALAARAEADLLALDWEAADSAWSQAISMLMPFDEEEAMAVAWRGADALMRFGNRFAQLGAITASEQRIAKLEEAAFVFGDLLYLAKVRHQRALALNLIGEREGGTRGLDALTTAAALLRQTVDFYHANNYFEAWTTAMGNLGGTLRLLGERIEGNSGERILKEATAVYRTLIKNCSKKVRPEDWAHGQYGLATVLRSQAKFFQKGENSTRLLTGAIDAFRQALTVHTKDAAPDEWAIVQNGLGNALADKGRLASGEEAYDLLNEAVSAFDSALEVITIESAPFDWAMIHNNVGGTLVSIGRLTSPHFSLAAFDAAVSVLKKALSIRTIGQGSALWAMTQNNLGNALFLAGLLSEAREAVRLFDDALTAFRETLTVYTPQHFPAQNISVKEMIRTVEAQLLERQG